MHSGEIIPKTLVFKWEIKNFCIACKSVGESLISPPFTTISDNNTMQWQLKLQFPKPEIMENRHWLSIYLKNLNTATVEVNLSFSILNSEQEKAVETGFNGVALKFDQNKLWGCKKFVEQSFVIDKTNDVLINNTFTILCEIIVESHFVHVKNSSLCNKKQNMEECASKLSFDLAKLFKNRKFTDITFIVDGEEVCVHKNILASRSSVFDAMFQSDMEEKKQSKVVIKDIKFEILMELFRYMYTEEVLRINELASDLLIAADKYAVEGLKSKCEKFLCDNITSNNVLEYLKLADVFNASKLKSEAIKFITSHSKDIVEKPDFKTFVDLHSNVLCEVFHAMAHNK